MKTDNQLPKAIPVDANLDDALLEYKYFRSLCTMTRGVTHDYNNIFTGLSGQFNLISNEADLGAVSEYRIQLIDDLLSKGVKRTSILYDFSRYIFAEKAPCSLDRILDIAVDSLNTLSRSHQFEYKKNGVLPRLYCRLKDIVMMLFYLGENALEAMPEGGVVTVMVELDELEVNSEEAILFSVKNKGTGISQAVRESLFQPFVTTKTSSKGLFGLGLYAALQIVKDHGGDLIYSDEQTGDTVFQARIPLPEKVLVEPCQQSSEKVLLTATPTKKISVRKKEIFFVIEDDEGMRDLIVNSLQRRGHVVFSAGNCAEAIEDFEFLHETITVLVIDVGLTDGDGFECLEKLLQISLQTKVVFMSGEDVEEQKYLKYDAAFLMKPFTAKDIEELVRVSRD